ncbi:MAG: flagellar hook-associated protein FlgK [Helicobacteraceae bacterium]|jgi:flagellar hook-associated protein 1 FlgK|nr:flagellar hook-associated protein FlgK [Helicobacteraceae bacterium]
MSLISALWTSYSGLQVSQLATDIISNNIANAENTSYTRQKVDISSRFSLHVNPGDIGTGATVDQVIRVHNEFVYARYRDAATNLQFYEHMTQTLQDASQYFPDIDEAGIQRDLLNYFSAWQKLSANPTESSQKTVVAEAAKNLALSMRQIRDKLSEMQRLENEQVISVVNEVNKLAKEIASINQKIREVEASDYSHANQLRDERDNLELQIQKLTGAQIIKTGVQTMTQVDSNVADYDENYSIVLGGFAIVSDNSFHPIVSSATASGAGAQNAVYFQQRDLSLIDISKDITGGKLGAILDLRGRSFDENTGEAADGLLQKYKDALDVFARGLIQSTNQIYASSAVTSMTSDQIGDAVTVSASNARYTAIADLGKDVLLSKVQEGDMTIVAYDQNGDRIQSDIIVHIDPQTMSLWQVAEAINAQLSARNLDGEARVAGGQLTLVTGTTGASTKLGAALISEDMSLIRGALDMTGAKNLETLEATDIPFAVEDGTFTIGIYDVNGVQIAAREITIDKRSTNPLYSTLSGIAAQINMPRVDDNADNDMANDLDDFIVAGFDGNRLRIDVKDQNSELSFNIVDDKTGFAGAIGLNRFFDGSSAKNIDLNTVFKNDPAKIQAYDLPVVGNNEIANAMQQLQYQNVSFLNLDGSISSETIMGRYKFLAGTLAEDTATSVTSLETATAVENSVSTQFTSISGVNVDEELANLIRFQAGYSANARVISTIQIMLDALLGLKL